MRCRRRKVGEPSRARRDPLRIPLVRVRTVITSHSDREVKRFLHRLEVWERGRRPSTFLKPSDRVLRKNTPEPPGCLPSVS